MKHRVIDSPVGPLTLVVDDAGVLCALYTDGQKYVPDAVGLGERDDTIADDAVAARGLAAPPATASCARWPARSRAEALPSPPTGQTATSPA